MTKPVGSGWGLTIMRERAELIGDIFRLNSVTGKGTSITVEATRIIHDRLPQVRILILTLYTSCEHSVRAWQSGALGYVLKESIEEEIVVAIQTIMTGSCYFGVGVADPAENQGNAT